MNSLIVSCRLLLSAYKTGQLGQTRMPEDSNPGFVDDEVRLAYFTLPMSLNYQRDSYKLWEAALATITDHVTSAVFDVKASASMNEDELRKKLILHKVALQPNKHIATWQTISQTVVANWGSIGGLLAAANHDYVQLRELVQHTHKKGFPYLSGPKIFNYWCFILTQYCGVELKHADQIDIAPDTHITQCSVRLGVISAAEADILSKEAISLRWRTALDGSGIIPIHMHAPLWFWSRNGFLFTFD